MTTCAPRVFGLWILVGECREMHEQDVQLCLQWDTVPGSHLGDEVALMGIYTYK